MGLAGMISGTSTAGSPELLRDLCFVAAGWGPDMSVTMVSGGACTGEVEKVFSLLGKAWEGKK